jgi:hypothetical protein
MSRLRIALLLTGVAAIGYAVAGAVADLGGKVGGVLLFLVAVLVLHDGVWLPLVLAAGALLGRFAPTRHRAVLRVAAIAGVAVTVAALPLTLGPGRTPDNPSALPLDYSRNLVLVLLVVAVVTGLVTARARIRAACTFVVTRAAAGRTGGRKESESSDDGAAG